MTQPLPAPFAEAYEDALDRLVAARFAERLWTRDHTLWSPDPTEISNRLGWLDLLDLAEPMQRIGKLVEDNRADEVGHVVLLGMGGSSLGAEALEQSYGQQQDFPALLVLDSTVPDRVRQVRAAIDPRRTFFLVASKSGGTAEVQALFDYFWGEVTEASDDPGRHFAAITDPGTSLGELATQRGFRELFLNDPNIGGRFSVLSLFGVVPAALAGIDVTRLHGRAEKMRRACGPQHHGEDNPGLELGAFLGAGALTGRAQATVLAPRAIAAFGLWAEQLIAESTGKHGKGILPVANEPPGEAEDYGDRRVFVHLSLASDPDPDMEAQAARLRRAGQPVWNLELGQFADLGAQFFLWQVATATAGHLIGVQPFDQPDVQSAKSRTHEVLATWEKSGALPPVQAPTDLAAELAREAPTYVAFLVYLAQDPALEAAIRDLRETILERFHVATTFGYGPRYLHSTGQLHKGGPPGGLHVQVVPRAMADLPIPGRKYGFATLAAAQADGDLLALQEKGRRCARLTLAYPAGDLARMTERLGR
jgi:glucose-6-phosphate isomerase/transaldolase/glucose-6-phosphate isomerase